MLEAIGAGNPDYKGQDWGDVWEKSPENEKLGKEIQEIIASRRDASKNDEARDDREYAMPYIQQWLTVVKRSFVAIWRDPPYVSHLHVRIAYETFTDFLHLCLGIGYGHVAHHYWIVQRLHFLESRTKSDRYAITTLLHLHDPHYCASSDPTTTTPLHQRAWHL